MSEKESIKSNIPEFSVSDLAQSMKRTLEETYGRVRVRGELSRVSIAASGHMYSSIKDDGAVIDAVCWKGTMNKLSVKPEEGLEVICTGRISTYPQRSNYQLIIESMELAGEGALLKMLEERRKKLAAEGLFDESRKKPIPFLPEVIGVVTSPTGAVIRDILHRISDRFPRHVMLWPAIVQGDAAAEQIAAAIDGFQTIDGHGLPKPDVLIVARGGGSLEDLMAFNEENVVRAVANSNIPVISAVGHETDTTLIDFAADLRAPTPTGAAEKAVPMRNELMALVLDDEKRLINAASRILDNARKHLDAEGRSLANPAKLLETKSQNLDFVGDKLNQTFQQFIGQKKNHLLETTARLSHPKSILNNAAIRVERWSEQLSSIAKKLTQDHEKRLNHAAKMLEAYSFQNVLERGFVVVRDNSGSLISNAEMATSAGHLELQFKDEKFVSVNVDGGSDAPRPRTQAQTKPKPQNAKKKKQINDEKQQSLF